MMDVKARKRSFLPQITSMYVVDRSAAKLGPDPLPLDRNHSEICKFSGQADRVWKRIGPNLRILGENARKSIVDCNHAPAPSISIPERVAPVPDYTNFQVQFRLTGLPVCGNFVDRDAEMKEMERSLLTSEPQAGRRIHILHGLSCIGKTQLAIAYARKYQKTYSAIIWFNRESKDTLLQSFASFATYTRIDEMPESATKVVATRGQDTLEKANTILQWLARKENREWLMIFDNVDRDYQYEVQDPLAYDFESFLPAADQGSILITTRLPHLGELGTPTKVTTMNKEQARQIFINNLGFPPSDSDIDGLVTRLGSLPLALVQAGRYMRETGTTCQSYLRLYETSWSELQANVPRLRDYPNGSIQTTWSISYDHIKKSDSRAAKLLQLWAYLNHQDLWFELLKRGSQPSQDPDWFQYVVRSEITFKGVIKRLLDYSLIEIHQDVESYSMHPVVHDWCRESMNRGNDRIALLALSVVGVAVPEYSEPEYWVIQQRLLPHANRCIQWPIDKAFPDTTWDRKLNHIFHRLGVLYADQGKPAEAEEMYQRALSGKEKAWGPKHTSTLDTVHNLGLLYMNQGKLAEAEEMCQRALSGYEKAWGPEHTSRLDIINNLGLLYINQGKLAEAEEMCKRALIGYEKAWGPEHISTLYAVNNLGLLYINQGKLAEAEEMCQRALIGKEKAWGPEHISTLYTVNNIGLLYINQGKLAEAEEMYQRALSGYEKAWGPEHTSTLETVQNLGGLYMSQGKLAEAEEMYQRALNGYRKLRDPDDPSILLIRRNLNLLRK